MKKQIAFLSFALVMSTIFFYSCSKSSDSTPAPAVTIVGNWTKTVQTYPFIISIISNNSYTVSMAGTIGESGTYTSTSSSITLNATGGTSSCINIPGKYNFSISGNTLSFSLVSDTCNGRSDALVGGAWTKQ